MKVRPAPAFHVLVELGDVLGQCTVCQTAGLLVVDVDDRSDFDGFDELLMCFLIVSRDGLLVVVTRVCFLMGLLPGDAWCFPTLDV